MAVPKCAECKYSKEIVFNRYGIGMSAGSNYSDKVYICEYPKMVNTYLSLNFRGKTSPRNCPLRRVKGDTKDGH